MNRTQPLLFVLLLAVVGGVGYEFFRARAVGAEGEYSKSAPVVPPSPTGKTAALVAAPPAAKKDNPALPIKERLEVYRERLLSGRAIVGVAIIPRGEDVLSLPTAFTLGHATRIVLADRSVLEFTPSLNEDGSVRYAIREMAANGVMRQLPDLIQVPWEGFTLDAGGNCLFGFDPDEMN